MKFLIILLSIELTTACGTIKTESTIHTDPVKVELSGSALLTIAIKADPTVAALVNGQCQGSKECMNVTTASLTDSISQTLINLGIVK
jgi:hypothetical protein